ncbi:hypothetical protein [Helicobacter sp. 23-1045]
MCFEICLEDFRVSAIIGILPSEREKAQNLVVNLRVEFRNSFSGNHSADLANRLKAHRTQSPLSLCRFTKNYESTTAIPSVVDSANLKSKNNPSLRGSVSVANTTKQSKKNNIVDCHDFATQNLAMTKKTHKIAESNAKNTHPLAPSAREGGFLDSASAREGGENVDSTNIIDYAILREMILATLKTNQFFYLENALVAIKEAILAQYPQILRLEIGIAKLEIFDDCVPRVRLKWSANDRFSD